jgi:putative spermidine/putrescine transport system substrate-binding protein
MRAPTLIGAAALLAASILPAGARDLSVTLRRPSLLAPWQSVFIAPFTAATGIRVSPGVWSGGIPTLTQQVKAPDSPWGLVMVDSEELAAGCASGLLEKLDWTQIGGREHYLPIAVSDCGVGALLSNTVLAWDRDKLAGSPGWADFWDVTKFPGKRGLHKGVRGNLEIALMADGVAPGDVYKTLSSADGLDRAFRKLDQLRPYIVWWDTPEDASRILGSGDVLMTSAPSAAIVAAGPAAHRNFAIQWGDSLLDVLSWAVAKGSPDLHDAMQFLYFSGTPAIEARLAATAAEGGLAKGANDGLPPELAAVSPTTAANMQTALRLDTTFWQANLAKLRQRFDAWLVKQ